MVTDNSYFFGSYEILVIDMQPLYAIDLKAFRLKWTTEQYLRCGLGLIAVGEALDLFSFRLTDMVTVRPIPKSVIQDLAAKLEAHGYIRLYALY